MSKLNLNTLASRVVRREGLKKSLSIGQVKEVIRLTPDELSCEPIVDVLDAVGARGLRNLLEESPGLKKLITKRR